MLQQYLELQGDFSFQLLSSWHPFSWQLPPHQEESLVVQGQLKVDLLEQGEQGGLAIQAHYPPHYLLNYS